MSTNGRFEDPVEQQRTQPQEQGPNFFPERWNGGDSRQQGAPTTEQRLYADSYQNIPQDARQQYRDVPQEFGRQPHFCHHDGQGNTYNFYIREAYINMGNQTPGYDYRRQPQYDYRQYDQSYQNMNRRIGYYDDPYAQMYEQQARQQYMRQLQYEQAMYQRQMMQQRYYGNQGYDRGYYDPYYGNQPTSVYQEGIHGGRDGYTSSRTRINTGGYDGGYYGTPPFVPGGDSYGRNDMDRFIDLGFGVLDRVFANEANRRASRNGGGGYDDRYYAQQRPQYNAPNYYGNDNSYNNPAYRRGPQRSPQQHMPPGYNDVIRRRGY